MISSLAVAVNCDVDSGFSLSDLVLIVKVRFFRMVRASVSKIGIKKSGVTQPPTGASGMVACNTKWFGATKPPSSPWHGATQPQMAGGHPTF